MKLRQVHARLGVCKRVIGTARRTVQVVPEAQSPLRQARVLRGLRARHKVRKEPVHSTQPLNI